MNLVVASPPSQALRETARQLSRRVRPLSVDELRAGMGEAADGLSDEEIAALSLAVCRHIAAVFAIVGSQP